MTHLWLLPAEIRGQSNGPPAYNRTKPHHPYTSLHTVIDRGNPLATHRDPNVQQDEDSSSTHLLPYGREGPMTDDREGPRNTYMPHDPRRDP